MFAVTTLAAQSTPVAQSQLPVLPGEESLSVRKTETSNVDLMTMGMQLSSDFDRNTLNSVGTQQQTVVGAIQPLLGLYFSHSRFTWSVDYSPTVSRASSPSTYDSFSQLLDSSLQLALTKRLRFRLHEAFLKSANPFDQLRATEVAGAPIHNVSSGVSVTPANARTEQASAEVVYVLNAHSAAGIGGAFSSARYSLVPASQSPSEVLQDSSSADAYGYYNRQIARHQWSGFDYRMQKLNFNGGRSAALVHGLSYTHTIALSRAMVVSFTGGSERSVAKSVTDPFLLSPASAPGQGSAWHWSGGVTAKWSGSRTSVTSRVSRTIGDGGVLGAAQLSTISAEIKRRFAREFAATVVASYDYSKSLTVPTTIAYASVAGGLTRALSRNLSLELQYWRVHLTSKDSLPAAFLADHSRFSMSLIYNLKYPLGR